MICHTLHLRILNRFSLQLKLDYLRQDLVALYCFSRGKQIDNSIINIIVYHFRETVALRWKYILLFLFAYVVAFTEFLKLSIKLGLVRSCVFAVFGSYCIGFTFYKTV